MHTYLKLLEDVYSRGAIREGRNARTWSVFGRTLSYDLQDGFPILTTKKMAFRAITAELIGFLRGYRNADDFSRLGCNVWHANANDPKWKNSAAYQGEGDLGRIYGVQWREWRTHTPVLRDPEDSDGPYLIDGYQPFDQIAELCRLIREEPTSRRMVVSAWNPGELGEMCLPPCHVLFQVYCDGPYMDLQMYQRSADVFLGLPFNITSYALLLWILARSHGYVPRRLHMALGDVHLYEQHIDQLYTQIGRAPRPRPELYYNIDVPLGHIQPWDFQPNLFELIGYDPHPKIDAEMIV